MSFRLLPKSATLNDLLWQNGRASQQLLRSCYRQHCAQRKALVFKLLKGRYRGFRPAVATRCTDGGEIWHGGGPSPCQISPTSVQR